MSPQERNLAWRIGKAGREGRWEEALALLQAEAGLQPNVIVLTAALDACARSLKLGEAQALFQKVEPTRRGFGIMVNLHSRLRRVEDAERLVRQMPELSLQPDIVTHTSLMTGYSMLGRWEDALALLDRVVLETPAADTTPEQWQVTFNVAMSACARAGRAAEARSLLARLAAMGTAPNHAHYNSVITACATAKDAAGAREAFEEMQARGLPPRVEDYNVLLQAVPGGTAGMFQLLDEMTAAGLTPVVDTVNGLLFRCLSDGDVAGAERAKALLDGKRIAPNSRTLRLLEQLSELKAAAAAASLELPLPEGWASAVDPSSGQPYYWQVSDPQRTTTWQRPAA